ncbi:primosomal protein N' [bacterium]|nr:primosomal protein N' [bacterium]
MKKKFRQYASVAVDAPIFDMLIYGIPDEYIGILKPGWRVMVELRRRLATGYIIELLDSPPDENFYIKAISDVPDNEPIFSENFLKLCEFISNYYIAPLGETLSLALPTGISFGTRQVVFLIQNPQNVHLTPTQKKIVSLLSENPLDILKLSEKIGRSGAFRNVAILERMGIVGRRYEYRAQSPPKNIDIAYPAKDLSPHSVDEILKRATKQASALKYLLTNGPTIASHLRKLFGSGAVKNLIEKGFIEIRQQEIFRRSEGWLTSRSEIETLTDSQKKAIDKIAAAIQVGDTTPILIHGITGSGKTLVYLEAARMVRAQGRGVLVLVPEVALTPQMWGAMREYFGEDVAVLHSYLSAGERADAWRKLKRGDVKIALGARSAVFAPVQDIGLIVVDEEQDQSYKQGRAPFYNARDVAIMRGKIENSLVVLGSATPSVESYYNATVGKYHLIEMPERVPGAKLPDVKLVDLKKLRSFEKIFSPLVKEYISKCSDKGEQAILLLNRRGYSSFIICPQCGYVPKCPNCDLTLTYHRVGDELKCHWCDFSTPAHDKCPNCGNENFKHRGKGTQKIELELYDLIDAEKIFRIDSDAISRRGALRRILEQFAASPGSVLVGTQMVAKGHHFPNVTLVVVIDADIGLSFPDFRAYERTFQLLAQVAGRAGRGKSPGTVIIQTRNPDSPAIKFALKHDYVSFFKSTITHRQVLEYPPYSRLVRILARSKDSLLAQRALRKILQKMTALKLPGVKPLNPTKPPLAKLKGEYRWHLLVKTKNIKVLLPFLKSVAREKFKNVQVRIDVDPYEMI